MSKEKQMIEELKILNNDSTKLESDLKIKQTDVTNKTSDLSKEIAKTLGMDQKLIKAELTKDSLIITNVAKITNKNLKDLTEATNMNYYTIESTTSKNILINLYYNEKDMAK